MLVVPFPALAQMIMFLLAASISRLLGLDGGRLRKTGRLDGLSSLRRGGSAGGGRGTGSRRGRLSLGLLGAEDTLQTGGLVGRAPVLFLLKLSKTTCLGVHILELLLSLVVCSSGTY